MCQADPNQQPSSSSFCADAATGCPPQDPATGTPTTSSPESSAQAEPAAGQPADDAQPTTTDGKVEEAAADQPSIPFSDAQAAPGGSSSDTTLQPFGGQASDGSASTQTADTTPAEQPDAQQEGQQATESAEPALEPALLPVFVPPPSDDPTVAAGQAVAQAVAEQDTQAAASSLAQAVAADPGQASAAASIAAASGDSASLAAAAVRAVQEQGASAEAMAQALSEASGGTIDPSLLRSGSAASLAQAVDQNIKGGWVMSCLQGIQCWPGGCRSAAHIPPSPSLTCQQSHPVSLPCRRLCGGDCAVQLEKPWRRLLRHLLGAGRRH